MRSMLIAMAAMMFSNTATEAQTHWPHTYWGGGHHASTAAEGRLNGAARLAAARGMYLRGLGQYQIDHQKAVGIATQNWADKVRTRWDIQDEYKERNKTPTANERWKKRLDMAEEKAHLQKREDDLRAAGILPPKVVRESGFRHYGKFFHSIEEWKTSPEYKAMKEIQAMEKLTNDLKKISEEARQQQALRTIKEWNQDRFGYTQRAEKKAREQRIRNLMGEKYWHESHVLTPEQWVKQNMDATYRNQVKWLKKQGREKKANNLEQFRLRQLNKK